MPVGQAHTTWFPELKTMLKNEWNFNSNIPQHFELVKMLNDKLAQVRKDLNVKPPMIWCNHCNGRHEGRLSIVTITSMYFGLERFELCAHKDHLELKRNWKKYSKQNLIDIHGNPITEKNK